MLQHKFKLIILLCISVSSYGELNIFISSSMPEARIIQLLKIAKKTEANVLIRGFKDNSLTETIKWCSEFLKKTEYAIDIDPKKFEEFNIQVVPSFVLAKKDIFDKIAGNVTVEYVLDKISKEGDLKEEARVLLNTLKKNK